jgi:hypothetical protein
MHAKYHHKNFFRHITEYYFVLFLGEFDFGEVGRGAAGATTTTTGGW